MAVGLERPKMLLNRQTASNILGCESGQATCICIASEQACPAGSCRQRALHVGNARGIYHICGRHGRQRFIHYHLQGETAPLQGLGEAADSISTAQKPVALHRQKVFDCCIVDCACLLKLHKGKMECCTTCGTKPERQLPLPGCVREAVTLQ